MTAAVEFAAAEFSIDGHRLMGPVSLRVPAGETLVLLGKSGSGKTTTLRLVNRLLDPTAGEVTVRGTATRDWDPIVLRRSIGYVIQEVGLLPHFTVRRNVGIVPELMGWPSTRIADRVDELLATVGLDPEEHGPRHPHALSGGQRQRVGVARALAADQDLLLCDEPFGAVDPVIRRELRREFRTLVHQLGKTVIFVTHDLHEAEELADRIALFEAGRVGFVGSVDEFRDTDHADVRAFRGLA